jgi:hypothetical protein
LFLFVRFARVASDGDPVEIVTLGSTGGSVSTSLTTATGVATSAPELPLRAALAEGKARRSSAALGSVPASASAAFMVISKLDG